MQWVANRYSKWNTQFWGYCCALIILVIGAISLTSGAHSIPLQSVINSLFEPNNSVDSIIIWKLRLPRFLVALAAGCGLALAGMVLQSITRNPLASPSLTGVTAGAALGVVASFVYLPSIITPFYYPFAALIGGLGAASLTFFVAGHKYISPMRLALAGVTVSFMASAVTSVMLLSTGPQSATLLFWLSGGLQGRSWEQLYILLPWLVFGVVGVLVAIRPMALLTLGDDAASSMGVDSGKWRIMLGTMAVCITAGVVSVVGPIAFVGLCVPHIARLLGARTIISSILLSSVLGMLLLATADLFARTVAAPREIPISVLTALVGGPLFIALVYRERG